MTARRFWCRTSNGEFQQLRTRLKELTILMEKESPSGMNLQNAKGRFSRNQNANTSCNFYEQYTQRHRLDV